MNGVHKTVESDVMHERRRQFDLWGEQNRPPLHWLAIAMEELGEASKAAIQNEPEQYRLELVQVAAVIQTAIDCFDRNYDNPTPEIAAWMELFNRNFETCENSK